MPKITVYIDHENAVLQRELASLMAAHHSLLEVVTSPQGASLAVCLAPPSLALKKAVDDVFYDESISSPFYYRDFDVRFTRFLARLRQEKNRIIVLRKGLEIDVIARSLRVVLTSDKKPHIIELTEKETELLSTLYDVYKDQGREHFFSKKNLLSSIWGISNADVETHTVETHIYRLRQKLDRHGLNGLIVTGDEGYRLDL